MEAADTRKVVAFGAENGLHMIAGIFGRGDVAVTEPAVNLDVCFFRRLGRVVREGRRDSRFRGRAGKFTFYLLLGRESKDAQERRDRKTALAVHLDVYGAVGIGLYLYPDATGRNDLGREKTFSFVGNRFEENTVTAGKLRDDDALDTIDDEGAVRRHPWKIREEYLLLLLVACGLVFETHDHREWGLIGFHRTLREFFLPAEVAKFEFDEFEFKLLAGVIRDG